MAIAMPRRPRHESDETADILSEIAQVQGILQRQLGKDLRVAAVTLTPNDVRVLIDLYYQTQRARIRLGNQTRAESDTPVPMNAFLQFLYASYVGLEARITQAMEVHAPQSRPGRWLLNQYGIGPVLTAGLLAHLLPGGVPKTAGSWWRFAGLIPGIVWKPGEKRPWNARLKTLLWKCSSSMVRFHSRDACFYGHIYAARKAYEVERNTSGALADEAARALREKRYGADTEARKAYEQGMLPPAHLEARAKRYAAKYLLSHLHYVCHVDAYGHAPRDPYAIAFLDNHQHHVLPPGWPCT